MEHVAQVVHLFRLPFSPLNGYQSDQFARGFQAGRKVTIATGKPCRHTFHFLYENVF
ncbi:MAG: hypothetical protein JXR84_19235 [Anaerolineae bacterium]|nr:hypothetical protein [Anaerolineae bacterium]